MKEALLYEKLDNSLVSCFLCARQCRIALDKFGFCGVRQNIGGKLYTYSYGKVIASYVDPIEKKPLYHFLPGSTSFSIATPGCNFRCGFCQNWEISQSAFFDGQENSEAEVTPQEIVEEAIQNKCQSISYTYTEPTIFFEYALEISKLARGKGLKNVFVTNGYMTEEALRQISPYLDAANVDLKFFKDSSYKKICFGSLKPVLDTIRLMRQMKIWVEVTTLIIPDENDSQGELEGIAEFIREVDQEMPWHVSGFHPDYKFIDHSATPEEVLKKAVSLGHKAGLKYVYAGNVLGWGNDTFCPECKKLLIKREVFNVLENNIIQGKCRYCGVKISGEFLPKG